MTLEDIINELKSKWNYLFKVSIPGSSFVHHRTSVTEAVNKSGTIEEYFDRIIRENKPKTILVELFSPNGSSFRDRGKHVIFLHQTEAFATNATQNATNATQNATNATMGGINETNRPKNTGNMMDIKEKIEFETLKVKHDMLSGVFDTLKAENAQLRKKVDELHEEKLALVKENSVSNERNKLDMEKAVFEAQKQQKEGLSGLMGELNENPEVLKLLVGIIKPDHPMLKDGNYESMEGTRQIEPPRFHDDDNVNALLTDMPNTIKNLDPKAIAKIYYIFMEGFAKKPENIHKVYEMLFPGAPTE